MSFITNLIKKMRRISAKQAVVAGVFMLAIGGGAAFSFAQRQAAEASTSRDNSANAIMRGGALSASEYITKLQNSNNGTQRDLQTIAKNFHSEFNLQPSEYSRFKSSARMGYAYKDGRIIVDGQTVMTNAWSIGRQKKSTDKAYNITGAGTFWYSYNHQVFRSEKIPVLVMFNDKGEVDYAALTPCGNQVGGKKVKVTAECKTLTKKEIGLNKFEFTTNVNVSSLAKVVKVEYFLDGQKIGESNNAASGYKLTYSLTKSGTVTSKVHVQVPGKKTIVVTSAGCATQVTFKQPHYKCTDLKAVIRNEDEDKTTYRVTVTTAQGNGATLKNADFLVDGQAIATDVATKDAQGNIYYDVELENGNSYTIASKVKFDVNGRVETAKDLCETRVSPKKPYYACDMLRATTVDEAARKFRFTVVASFGDGAELKSADFAINGDNVATDVTEKDAEGNIYHEIAFEADGKARTVQATVHFNVMDGVKSVECEVKVTPEQKPMCPVPGKEHLPPGDKGCYVPCPHNPELPKDSDKCKPPKEVLGKETELPKTGAGSVIGLFASATGVGAAAHRLYVRRSQK